jgi:hypothetical protein
MAEIEPGEYTVLPVVDNNFVISTSTIFSIVDGSAIPPWLINSIAYHVDQETAPMQIDLDELELLILIHNENEDIELEVF